MLRLQNAIHRLVALNRIAELTEANPEISLTKETIMKLSTKLIAASLLAVGGISAHAATPAYVYAGTMFDEPARTVTPHQPGNESPSYVYGGSTTTSSAMTAPPRQSFMPNAADIKARALAYIG